MLALIAGTGFDRFLKPEEEKIVETPFGSRVIYKIQAQDQSFYYLPRHGLDHSVAPHLINYRANLWALKDLGVDKVLSLCAVGSLNKDFKPGNFVAVKDILDFTKGRTSTFYDGQDRDLKHLDVSNLYSKSMVQEIKNFFSQRPESFQEGIYVCTEGPRFETAAEIKFYQMIGGDLVGMTGSPEVFLARELSMNYASLALVTNFCTGVASDSIEFVSSFDQYQDLIESLLSYLSRKNIPKQESIFV
ncbi:S-methyl-5'-thioinosine phosphorylase [Urinicoccus massiliensis]|uniref:Purine nucleoside phosphorylase n=1 Tax=Urinicoccus massiliensis TaxID=1723382 RepID=A0A8H2M4A0_9FIRM|nr:MTAP family purine nucleoside phosphorylase [Urinicoccus massiliensis]VFB16307.1 S-methyl-5'-thioinosine phosphorylase [Urinicoccus massiliensis]